MKSTVGSFKYVWAPRWRAAAWLPCVALAAVAMVLVPGVVHGQGVGDPLVVADDDPDLRAGDPGCGVAPWEATALEHAWDDPRCAAAAEAREGARATATAHEGVVREAVVDDAAALQAAVVADAGSRRVAWWPATVTLTAAVQAAVTHRRTAATQRVRAHGAVEAAWSTSDDALARVTLGWRVEVRALWLLGDRRRSGAGSTVAVREAAATGAAAMGAAAAGSPAVGGAPAAGDGPPDAAASRQRASNAARASTDAFMARMGVVR